MKDGLFMLSILSLKLEAWLSAKNESKKKRMSQRWQDRRTHPSGFNLKFPFIFHCL